MKNLRKILAVMLTIIMALGVCVSAFAATSASTITVTNAKDGETYSAYKILDVTYDGDNVSYFISANSPYYEAFSESGLFTLVATNGKYQLVLNSGVTQDDLSKFIAETVASISPSGSASASATAEGTTATIEISESGYYYVTTTTGSAVAINTATASDVEVTDKNPTPSDSKLVLDSDGNYSATNTAGIGDTVSYQATIENAEGLYNVVYHDVLDAGLSFDSTTVVVTVGGKVIESGYTINADPTDYCTFEISFDDGVITGTVVITYDATVNENAVVGEEGNVNKEYITYGDNQTTVSSIDEETSEDGSTSETVVKVSATQSTKTIVSEFNLIKVNENEDVLQGATFEISLNGTTISFVLEDGVYRTATQIEAALGDTTTKTIEAGTATIQGLPAGEYTLTETVAPDGYNILTESVTFVVNADGSVTYNGVTGNSISIVNQAGTVLPSTGGIGTTIFYVIGIILMLAAAVLLITKRRMRSAK